MIYVVNVLLEKGEFDASKLDEYVFENGIHHEVEQNFWYGCIDGACRLTEDEEDFFYDGDGERFDKLCDIMDELDMETIKKFAKYSPDDVRVNNYDADLEEYWVDVEIDIKAIFEKYKKDED